MSRNISNETKHQRKMGTGTGKDYIPWITTSEFNSKGTTSVINDWKTGRPVHCLSQGEALWYYILRWDDNNVDIREQFPLDVNETVKIAHANGFKHPYNDTHVMTTDFVITKADGSLHAYSVKPTRHLCKRTLEVLCIEKIYWLNHGCEFSMLFKTDVNKILAQNISNVVEYYNPLLVFDKYSAFKHKLATKEYRTDLEKIILTNEEIDKLMEV